MKPDHSVSTPPATPRLKPLARVNGQPTVVPWPARHPTFPAAAADAQPQCKAPAAAADRVSDEDMAAALDFRAEDVTRCRTALASLGEKAAYREGLRAGRRDASSHSFWTGIYVGLISGALVAGFGLGVVAHLLGAPR